MLWVAPSLLQLKGFPYEVSKFEGKSDLSCLKSLIHEAVICGSSEGQVGSSEETLLAQATRAQQWACGKWKYLKGLWVRNTKQEVFLFHSIMQVFATCILKLEVAPLTFLCEKWTAVPTLWIATEWKTPQKLLVTPATLPVLGTLHS